MFKCCYTHQECFIEFKGTRKLLLYLMDTIKPLEEDWAPLVFIKIHPMTTPVGKPMSKLQPFTVDKNFESLLLSQIVNCKDL